MANKNTLSVVFLVLFTVSFNLFIPITFLSVCLSSYGIIDKTNYYKYAPSSPSPIEKLNIKSDIGNININYVTPSVSYLVNIELHIQMSGFNLSGKDYSDYFFIDWNTTNSFVNFTMGYKSNIDQSEIISLIKNITITVNLREDIIFNIYVVVLDGNVDVEVPYGVSTYNLAVNASNGDIFYDINHCSFEGNITGYTNNGDIRLKVYNIQCTKNVIWNLTIQNGDLDLEIYQYKEMGVNITGTMVIPSGKLKLNYDDNISDVGAIFIFPLFGLPYPTPPHPGFETDIFEVNGLNKFGHLYKTIGFPDKNNFILKFNLTNDVYNLNIRNQ